MDLEQFTQNIDAIYLVLDAQSCITEVNETTCKYVGRTRDQLMGRKWIEEFVPEAERQSVVMAFERAIRTNDEQQIFHFSNHIQSSTGKIYFIRWDYTPKFGPDGNVAEVISFGYDVTEEQKNRLRLQTLYDQLPVGMFQYIIDKDGNDSIDLISPACEEIWGLSKEELQNDPSKIWDLTHPEDLVDLSQSVIKSGETLTIWKHRWRIITPAGKEKVLEGRGVPQNLISGGILWNTVVFEVTDDK